MSEDSIRDQWVQRVLGVDLGRQSDSVLRMKSRGPASADPVKLALLFWEGVASRAVSALRQLADEMRQREDPEYAAAASIVDQSRRMLETEVDSARAAARMSGWLAMDDVIAGCDDLLHLRQPLLDAIEEVAGALSRAR